MSKTPEQLAEEYAKYIFSIGGIDPIKEDFLTGYKTAEEKYKAQIKELETQLENWQHNAKHGDEGL